MRLTICTIPIIFAGFALIGACRDRSGTPAGDSQLDGSVRPFTLIDYAATGQFPHDTTSFTEGLLFYEGHLYESTAHVDEVPASRSWFGPVDPQTGRISPKVQLPIDQYFGEGICFLNGKVYQLTYKEKVGFVYDAKTFQRIGTFTPPGREGWGMTTDGRSLLISDGTTILYFMDPVTFRPTRKIRVTENGVPPDSLNELEYIKGFIYANRYTKDFILKIDPANGKVLGRIDCTSLVDAERSKYPGSKELNGIAYDSLTDKVYITGKCWPDLFTIRFAH